MSSQSYAVSGWAAVAADVATPRSSASLLLQSVLQLLLGGLLSALLGFFAHDLLFALLDGVPSLGRGYLVFSLVLLPLVLAMILTELVLLRSLREMVAHSESFMNNPALPLL